MKVTDIRFRRLQSHDRGYGHDAVEAEAQIEDGETAEEAMSALKLWVMEQLGRVRDIDRAVEQLQSLNERIRDQERTRDRLKAETEQYRDAIKSSDKLHELAKANGLIEEAKLLFDDTVPF